jgi:hypothetical protein
MRPDEEGAGQFRPKLDTPTIEGRRGGGGKRVSRNLQLEKKFVNLMIMILNIDDTCNVLLLFLNDNLNTFFFSTDLKFELERKV